MQGQNASYLQTRQSRQTRLCCGGVCDSIVQDRHMVFIDVDKASCDRYFCHAMKLTHVGSLIVADNVIRQGKVLEAERTGQNVIEARRFKSP